jgi:hypothetical protein
MLSLDRNQYYQRARKAMGYLTTNRLGAIAAASAVSIASAAAFTSLSPAQAQSCAALPVVGGSGTEVEKSVSPPSTGVTRSNWNTDFFVPSNRSFRRYVARIVPKNGGEYKVRMSLKYNNDTADRAFERTIDLAEGKPYDIQGAARNNATPYQVNVEVGGLQAIGNSYTVSAFGCN